MMEPVSLAVAASIIEHACTRPRRVVPMLRRNSRRVIGCLVQETSDPALDMVNQMDFRFLVLIFLLLQYTAHLRHRLPVWVYEAAYLVLNALEP